MERPKLNLSERRRRSRCDVAGRASPRKRNWPKADRRGRCWETSIVLLCGLRGQSRQALKQSNVNILCHQSNKLTLANGT